MHPPPALRAVSTADAAPIAAIYNPYVLETPISFEEAAVGTEEMAARIAKVQASALPWLVAERDGALLGYAYATPWRERRAYRHSVECSVYVDRAAAGQGLGRALYDALFPLLQQHGCHAVMAGIALPNEASVRLHERMGLRKVAHFREVGFKFGAWHDVGYWERVL